jgi:hypothetical protein
LVEVMMRRNPERLAWLVLILSFTICALSAAVLPPAARQLIDNRTSTRAARLDIIHGTVLVRRLGTPSEQGATAGMQVEPGDQVRTAGDARAILWLPSALAVILFGTSILRATGVSEGGEAATGLVLGSLLAGFSLWAWWRYRAVSIRTDALGITWTAPGRRLFIPWSDLKACRARDAGVGAHTIIVGGRTRIYAWCGLTDYEALQSEVSSHIRG